MKALLTTLSIALAITAFATAAEAGPWVKAPGDAYVKAGATFYTSEDSFNQGRDTGLAYTGQTFNLYGEVGLPYGFQAVVDVPLVMGTNTSAAGVNYINQTLGDLRLELDYAILPQLPLAIGVEVKTPLYTPLAEQGPSDPSADFIRTKTRFPDPGDGNVDATIKLMTGFSFHPVPAWITGELGYRARLGGFIDGLFVAASGGFFVWPEQIALGFYANSVVNLGEDADPLLKSTKEFTYVQGFILITANPVAPDLSLSISAGAIVQAENTSKGNDISVGVSYDF